jgi:hypothetical protein
MSSVSEFPSRRKHSLRHKLWSNGLGDRGDVDAERMVELDDNVERATLRSIGRSHPLPDSAETVNSNRK